MAGPCGAVTPGCFLVGANLIPNRCLLEKLPQCVMSCVVSFSMCLPLEPAPGFVGRNLAVVVVRTTCIRWGWVGFGVGVEVG